MNFERINPLTGDVASTATAMQVADIPAIAESAQQGFEAWSRVGPNDRRSVLLAAADALQGKQTEFVDAMMSEIGATAGWAMFNLGLAASMLREAASITTQISGEVIPSDKPGLLAMAIFALFAVLMQHDGALQLREFNPSYHLFLQRLTILLLMVATQMLLSAAL